MLSRYGLTFAVAAITVVRAAEVNQLSPRDDDDECNAMLQVHSQRPDLHVSPCTKASSRPCKAGFRQPSDCKRKFTYKSKNYTGCTTADSEGKPWCPPDSFFSFLSPQKQCYHCIETTSLPAQEWDVIADKIRCLTATVIAGTATERLFVFENRHERLHPQTALASAGKWPAIVAIAGAVHDGSLDWDTRASDVFTWWKDSPDDSRSRITLRHLLQFSSGFQAKDFFHGYEIGCMRPGDTDPEECSRNIYEGATHLYEPGTTFTYNGFHLQIALTMAAKRSNKGNQDLLRDNLYIPFGMSNTKVLGGKNPIPDAYMYSSGDDYAKFLQKLLSYEVLPKEILDVVETPAGNKPLPVFAMGHEADPDGDHWWGGTVYPHLNREVGFYVIFLPKKEDYLGNVPFLVGAPSPNGQYVGAGRRAFDWIEDDVKRAVSRRTR